MKMYVRHCDHLSLLQLRISTNGCVLVLTQQIICFALYHQIFALFLHSSLHMQIFCRDVCTQNIDIPSLTDPIYALYALKAGAENKFMIIVQQPAKINTMSPPL